MTALSPPLLTAIVLIAATVLASWRLLRRRAIARASRAGFALRLALQPVLAALLFFGLFPPQGTRSDSTLLVFTANANTDEDDDALLRIALPEAPAHIAAPRAPDLATVLRRHPQVRELRVRGEGLEPRDIDAARGHLVRIEGGAQPHGLVELHAPLHATVGNRFTLHGRIAGLPGAALELLDPSGSRIARNHPDEDGRFALSGTLRSAGRATFSLRLVDADDQLVETLPWSITAIAPAPLNLLALGGAPNAELKYLRRWASDTGAQLHTRVGTGAGLVLGDAQIRLDEKTLEATDALLLDSRSLEALRDAEFAAIGDALAQGMGVLLRLDTPPGPRTRARLRDWGFAADAEVTTSPTRLAPVPGADAATLPDPSRLTPAPDGRDAVALLRDARGEALAHWRAVGRGRIGVVTLVDSYRLVLAGQGPAHAALWAGLFAEVARAGDDPATPLIPQPLWPLERAVLCGVDEGARIVTPDGQSLPLLPDPATGTRRCAAFWPTQEGWHHLIDEDSDTGFAVLPADTARAWRAQHRSDANAALAAWSTDADADAATAAPSRVLRTSAHWPWLALWLVMSVLAWWLERRAGRNKAQSR